MTKKFEFGEKVLIAARIYRSANIIGDKTIRFWAKSTYFSPKLEGIFLKQINLYDGNWEENTTYSEDGPEYDSYFKYSKVIPGAWICIKGLKPEKVFLEDVIKIEKAIDYMDQIDPITNDGWTGEREEYKVPTQSGMGYHFFIPKPLADFIRKILNGEP